MALVDGSGKLKAPSPLGIPGLVFLHFGGSPQVLKDLKIEKILKYSLP